MLIFTRSALFGSRRVYPTSRQGSSWVGAYLSGGYEARRSIIQTELIPLHNAEGLQDTLATDLSKTVGGVSAAIQLRIDLQQMSSELTPPAPVMASTIPGIDNIVQNWLTAAFCVDSLTLERVTFDSSGSTLETIARADTVHAVRSISALKKRFESGRRCYALFHHALPTFPLAFIHVGLTSQLANSMRFVLVLVHNCNRHITVLTCTLQGLWTIGRTAVAQRTPCFTPSTQPVQHFVSTYTVSKSTYLCGV